MKTCNDFSTNVRSVLNRRLYILHLLIGTLVLALILRTWLVMGLIEPIIVSGSSMAPALRGAHRAITCQLCGHKFDIGAEFPVNVVECPPCGNSVKIKEDQPRIHRGDAIVVDRTAFLLKPPSRWDEVVFRSPEDGALTVKRVIGLPGERVELREGNVWVKGEIVTKSLGEMRVMQRLVHEESNSALRWQRDKHSQWKRRNDCWRISASDGDWHWLRYVHPQGQPIQVDSVYNGGLSQRVFAARDLSLSVQVRANGEGELAIVFSDGVNKLHWSGILRSDQLIEAFAFDRCWKVFVDGELRAEQSMATLEPAAGNSTPFSLGVRNLNVELSELRLYRDVHHATLHEERGVRQSMEPVTLGPQMIYVLGDNVPVSIDSRHWGPLPLRLVIGRPLAIR